MSGFKKFAQVFKYVTEMMSAVRSAVTVTVCRVLNGQQLAKVPTCTCSRLFRSLSATSAARGWSLQNSFASPFSSRHIHTAGKPCFTVVVMRYDWSSGPELNVDV